MAPPSLRPSLRPSVRPSVAFPKTSIPLFWRVRRERRRRGEEEWQCSGGFVFIASPSPPSVRSGAVGRSVGRSDFTSTSGISFPLPTSQAQQQSHSFHRACASEHERLSCACLPASLPPCLSCLPLPPTRRCEAFDLSAPNRFVFNANERTNERTNSPTRIALPANKTSVE